MNIPFRKVTWYSKLVSIVFFVCVLPILTFYLGTRYQETKGLYSDSVAGTKLKPTEVPSDFITFKSDAGFQFKYPPEWQVHDTKTIGEDDTYRALAQILNSQSAQENSSSIEQFFVSETNAPCSEPTTINFSNSPANDTGWVFGGGINGDLLFRSVCVQKEGGSLKIHGEASYESKQLVDFIFASFTFDS